MSDTIDGTSAATTASAGGSSPGSAEQERPACTAGDITQGGPLSFTAEPLGWVVTGLMLLMLVVLLPLAGS